MNTFKLRQRRRSYRELLNEADVGDHVSLRWAVSGYGLGNEVPLRKLTTGKIEGIDGFNIIIRNSTGERVHVPIMCIEERVD